MKMLPKKTVPGIFYTILVLSPLITITQAFATLSSAFDGTWTGTLTSGVSSLTCTYNVTATINTSQKTIQWDGSRTDCSYIACSSCPKHKSFSNSLTSTDDNNTLSFSIEEKDNDQFIVKVSLSKDQKSLTGKGNIKDHNATYKINFQKK